MKTQLMEEVPAAASNGLYPFAALLAKKGYPSSRHFEVVRTRNGRGTGIKAKVAFDSRIRIAKISGYALGERRLHTLQMSSRIHLYDPWFSGLLLHSCDPNVFLDISELELWSIQAIHPGTLLTMDYATTEDVLFRQFPCRCGAGNCRGWITGMKEPLNAEGQQFMEQWRQRKRC
ncbi:MULTISPECIES: SET domain-containing protein-lysine N-methyltransferase [Pseudomonas]|uniref:SET domain-containing protein-lysine N-methyltransferase n=1 Tax=Pseudomonas gessardii TaxID=78544 RepID=A0A7Y1MWR0_9PSED|nr:MULTISPECIES: SET domain-containing protein-lysine N-methyltransferase [Pseudomonas]MBH3424318.1 SET domain-containing protein-lysine N-methyltransferase [Pseudomonas gessardii]MCF4979881.1 SET domain-containing protein-lysine N-methyltransferase [Pseudomonas gessardii]MCF4990684.1 SET domain-containing protein-lysine N-methyltransferase [Pseudomonas gessardii]MCF5084922.1 SET domain-containing protein-lysine N-methyltransferase [Pseudomonas gessardii]MCF5095619.1 SET domain-containing prot